MLAMSLLLSSVYLFPLSKKNIILDLNLNKTDGAHLFQQSNSWVVLLAELQGKLDEKLEDCSIG
jgi:hypothetical protein